MAISTHEKKLMIDANDKELTVFGFAKGYRAGLITFMLAAQSIAIVSLFFLVVESKNQNQILQAKLYEKMIEYMKPTKDKMNKAADKVITSSENLDSVSTKLLSNHQNIESK